MKNNNLFLTMAATVMMGLFAACSNDLTDEATVSPSQISFTSTVLTDGTRAATDIQNEQLANGLQVGLFADATKVNGADNALLVADGSGKLTTDATISWPATGEGTTFYAYAPYAEVNTGKINSSIDFTVATDQTTETGYTASDLLYASKSVEHGTTTVALGFTHKLSKVILKLKYTKGEMANPKVSLLNVVKDATLDIANGNVAAKDQATAGEVKIADLSTTIQDGTIAECAAVIVPQTIASGTKFIQVTVGDDTYKCGLTAEKTFASGKVYTFTVALDGKDIVIESETTSIIGWDTDGTGTEEENTIYPDAPAVVYGVGDYLLSDGTFIKKSAASSNSDNIIGVIFSTEVSATDAATYDAYVLGLYSINGTANPQKDATVTALTFAADYTAPTTLKDAAADLDGLTHTQYVRNLTDYTTNYPLFDFSGLSLTTPTGGTHSDWYVPSVGQAIQLLNNLGGAEIPTDSEVAPLYVVLPTVPTDTLSAGSKISFSNKSYVFGNNPALNDLLASIKVYTNDTEIIKGNRFATSTLIGTDVALMDLTSNFISSSTSEIKGDDGKNYSFSSDSKGYKTNAWGISSGGATSGRNRFVVMAVKANSDYADE